MRAVTVRTDDGTRAGVVQGDMVQLSTVSDVRALLEAMASGGTPPLSGETQPLETSELAPLVPLPDKIICVGVNYRSHSAEMGHEAPTSPTLFAKFSEALIGAHDPIEMPEVSSELDWEAELAIVIGRPVRNADRATAAAAIAGYTVCNDITARDWQRRTSQWLQGKTFQHCTPLGPELVTPDELGDPTRPPSRAITCEVDGVLRQSGHTDEMIFDPFDIVVHISKILTLRPGDVIATGTPAGVGAGMDPPLFLADGQVVRTSIEGIGTLENRCVRPVS